MKLLIAEDTPSNQALLRALMKNWDFEAEIVSNGREAVERVKSDRFDLCLMDLDMPVMNGYEATKLIHREQSYIPIMALSANPERTRCFELGIDDLLEKPYKLSELREKIIQLVVKTFRVQKTANYFEMTQEKPMDPKHAKELRDLSKQGLCKMNLKGLGAQDLSLVVHKKVPFKISEDFIENNHELTVFLDRSSDKPAECHLYRNSSYPMPCVYLTEEEFEEKLKQEDKALERCEIVIKKKEYR